MHGGGARARGQKQLRFFFFCFFSCLELFIFEQQILFGFDPLSLLTSSLECSALGLGNGVKI